MLQITYIQDYGNKISIEELIAVAVLMPQTRPGIRGTQVLSSVRMKKTQDSSKWLFLGNLIPEIESKATN